MLVSGEKPGFQALSKGLIVLLCVEVVRQGVPDHGAMHSECSASNSGEPMSWHHHQLLCGWPETLPADNTGDQCATVDKVLRSHAMRTSVHDDTELVRYSICHIEPVKSSCILMTDTWCVKCCIITIIADITLHLSSGAASACFILTICRSVKSCWRTASRRPTCITFAWSVMYKHDVIHKSGSTQLTRRENLRDERCYFNMHSKADISQLNLPHGNDN